MDEDFEQILFVCRLCYVYQLPPRQTTKGHRAADWGLDKPLWQGRMKVVSKGLNCTISLIDEKGALFAEVPIQGDEVDRAVESVVDSSRYFVVRVAHQGKHAFLGVGFKDRAESFDFNVALQDFKKSLHKQKESSEPYHSKYDFSLKEGEKIKINIKKKKVDEEDGSTKTSGSEVSLGNIGAALAQLSTPSSTSTPTSTPTISSISPTTTTTTKSSTNPFDSFPASTVSKSTNEPSSNPFDADPFGDSSSPSSKNSSSTGSGWVAF
eukprot:m.136633 g.136633  ORF g.136633 m.136633 type:complete len:266 (+) comp10788_c0_seq1:193-990(+)